MARSVQVGQDVQVDVPALGLTVEDPPITGKIIYVGDTVSTQTRTVAIRTQVDNKDLALKPQMLASEDSGAVESAGHSRGRCGARERQRPCLCEEGREPLPPDPVDLGASSGGQRPVLKGLSEGAEIVVEGAFHLNNERKRAELE